MRRIALILVLVAFVAAASGCFCYDWSDPMHPTVCPIVPKCDGRVPCNQRPDYSQRGNYP